MVPLQVTDLEAGPNCLLSVYPGDLIGPLELVDDYPSPSRWCSRHEQSRYIYAIEFVHLRDQWSNSDLLIGEGDQGRVHIDTSLVGHTGLIDEVCTQYRCEFHLSVEVAVIFFRRGTREPGTASREIG